MKHLKEPAPHLRQSRARRAGGPRSPHLRADGQGPCADRPVDAHRVQASLIAICRALHIDLHDADLEPPPPSSVLRTTAADPWHRRAEIFERMLSRGFGNAPPPDLGRMLEMLKKNLREIEALRSAAMDEQRRLETIEGEGREGRLRLGKAMDALTIDASLTRDEARTLRAAVTPLTQAAKAFPPQLLAAHKDLIFWEGRSAFQEPYRELAACYAKLADLTSRWYETRRRELEAEGEAVKKERVIADVDFQIKELRHSLANLEKSIEDRRQACQQKIAELGRRSEQVEGELINLASRFCAPLRSRPDLGQLFLELERVPAA
jgi:hypothetical protein